MYVCAQSVQLCPTLCDPMDHSLPGSSVHRIFLARILEWVAIPSSRGSSRSRDQTCFSWSPALPGGFFTTEPQGKPIYVCMYVCMYVRFGPCLIACRSLVPQPEIEHTFSAVKACGPNHVATRECPEHF